MSSLHITPDSLRQVASGLTQTIAALQEEIDSWNQMVGKVDRSIFGDPQYKLADQHDQAYKATKTQTDTLIKALQARADFLIGVAKGLEGIDSWVSTTLKAAQKQP